MRYGIPYKGSKNKIAEKVVAFLPSGERLVDICAGGCAITHAALLSGKWGSVLANDIDPMPLRLFDDAVHGRLKDRTEWVSREMFFAMKDTDPYIRYAWSFGNNGRVYLYSKELEPYKKALHEMIFAPTPTERRLKYRTVNRLARGLMGHSEDTTGQLESLQRLQSLERLQSLQRLESLQSLESLERLQSLQISNLDYAAVPLKDGDIVYADIPYKDCYVEAYMKGFDHQRFYDWAAACAYPVFISEYKIEDDRLKLVHSIPKRQLSVSTGAGKLVDENIYANEAAVKLLQSETLFEVTI